MTIYTKFYTFSSRLQRQALHQAYEEQNRGVVAMISSLPSIED